MSDRDSPAPPFVPKYDRTASDSHKRALEKLMSNPTKPADIPEAPQLKQIRAPRDMMRNVMGSSAGAGSGEFHVYKQARRREYERLQLMDEEERRDKERAAMLARQAQIEALNEKTSAKNKAKRDKRKARRLKKRAIDSENDDDSNSDSVRNDRTHAYTDNKHLKMAASDTVLSFGSAQNSGNKAASSSGTEVLIPAASTVGISVVEE